MAEPTTITITKLAEYSFRIEDDLGFVDRQNRYTGGITGDLVTILSMNGAPIYVNEPYTKFFYEDEDFASADALFVKLQEEDFFWKGSIDGSGGGGTFRIQDATDFLPSTLIGNQNKVIGVNGAQTGFILYDNNGVSRIQDATDWNGGTPMADKFVLIDSTGKFNQGNIDTVLNTPNPSTTFRLIQKGYQYDAETETYIYNVEPFVSEAGDIFAGIKIDEETNIMYYYPSLRWNGSGSEQDLNNHIWTTRHLIPFDIEPKP